MHAAFLDSSKRTASTRFFEVLNLSSRSERWPVTHIEDHALLVLSVQGGNA
jgi:hypothetical protein